MMRIPVAHSDLEPVRGEGRAGRWSGIKIDL